MILSVSRRTDLPRWYSEWLLRRLRAGEVLVRNPYRPGQLRRVPLSPAVVDAIVFWTKDPAPLLPWLDELDGMGYRYLFQFTLTPYGPEIEPGLRDKRAIVETFQVLGCRLGGGGCCGGTTPFCSPTPSASPGTRPGSASSVKRFPRSLIR